MSVVVKHSDSVGVQQCKLQLIQSSSGLMEYPVLVSVIGFVLPNQRFYPVMVFLLFWSITGMLPESVLKAVINKQDCNSLLLLHLKYYTCSYFYPGHCPGSTLISVC